MKTQQMAEILINVKVIAGVLMLLCFAIVKRDHIQINRHDADYLIGAVLIFETIGILGAYPWDMIGGILLRMAITGILIFKVIYKPKQI